MNTSSRSDHAKVAMARFRGMHEKRGRAGACERRSDLARDVAGLSDAAHHDPAAAVEDDRTCFRESCRRAARSRSTIAFASI